jgi:ribosomal protein S27E
MITQHATNHVLCPICGRGKIIMEEKTSDEPSLRLVLPGSKRKARWYIKCNICKNQIGITIKN